MPIGCEASAPIFLSLNKVAWTLLYYDLALGGAGGFRDSLNVRGYWMERYCGGSNGG